MMARRFIIPFCVALTILVGYNAAIFVSSKKTQRQHMLALLNQIPPVTQCLFLGNSLVEAGCDANAFDSAWPGETQPHALNIGLGATSPVEHYLILKQALERAPHVKFLVYGFFDDQLESASSGTWDELIGNRAFSYYFPQEAASFYTPGSEVEKLKLEMISRVPMLSERSSIWDKVEMLRRRVDEIGMPKHKTNRYGRVSDFSALEAADVPSFINRCNSAIHDGDSFSPPIQGILDLAAQHDVTVFLVEMPISPSHRKTFYSLPVWAEMREHLKTIAAKEHAVLITASDWVPDGDDFDDAVHLNSAGAKTFSRQLALTLARMTSHQPNDTIARSHAAEPQLMAAAKLK
jgi:hypothetical protein